MAEKHPLTVSYCTTCKGRLHHLKKTLPANMAAEKDNPNVEFVLLDYDSNDGMGDWVKANFAKEIASGRLRYAKLEDAPHFKMAHAKNMAHRLATGDILCNIDADNFIAQDFSRWLTRTFEAAPASIVTVQSTSIRDDLKKKFGHRLLGQPRPSNGCGGRVALMRSDFDRLGGYDEAYNAWGEDDVNIALRARELGIKAVNLPSSMWGSVIEHTHEERVNQMSTDDRAVSLERLERPRFTKMLRGIDRIRQHPEPRANHDGRVGCGAVQLNFTQDTTEIGPIGTELAGASAYAESQGLTRRNDWAVSVGTRGSEPSAQRSRLK